MYVKLGGEGKIRQLNSCRGYPDIAIPIFCLVNAYHTLLFLKIVSPVGLVTAQVKGFKTNRKHSHRPGCAF